MYVSKENFATGFRTWVLFELLMQDDSVKPVDKAVAAFCRLARKYESSGSGHWAITSIHHYGIKEVNTAADYFPVLEAEFEGRSFPVPSNYDTYLTRLYGDYMKMPPADRQKTHHLFDAYWR